ncbi:MAG: hypothetical protein QM749_10770 [Aquabacterium sp.]
MGAKLINALGLPKPLPLERYKAGQPVVQGTVLIGGGGEPELLDSLATVFKTAGIQSLAHEKLPQWVSVANKQGQVLFGFYRVSRWTLAGRQN